jgi:hypothetical protein
MRRLTGGGAVAAWSIADGPPRGAPEAAGLAAAGEGTTGDDRELGGQLRLQPKVDPAVPEAGTATPG